MKQPSRLLLISFSLLFCFSSSQAKTHWRQLAPGIDYTVLTPHPYNPWSQIHAFRIDLKHYRLNVVFARDHAYKTTSVKKLAKNYHALIAINGGFFTPDKSPIGLRVQEGVVRYPMKPTSWWGVFYTVNRHAFLSSQRRYRQKRNIDFAIQGGPRLIVNGRVPALKPGKDERSAICATRQGKVVILATDNAPVTVTTLAKIMLKNERFDGLNCYNGLNLDGGSSTQMYADIGKFKLNIRGFAAITDAVLVQRR